jgi:hypothetical protein
MRIVIAAVLGVAIAFGMGEFASDVGSFNIGLFTGGMCAGVGWLVGMWP